MPQGYLSLVLHAHLPYVRHPEHENFLEEKWLFEAITETYIPLISVFDRLLYDNVPFRLTFSMSPPLLSMLTDPLLQERYIKHLNKLIELVEKELGRTYGSPFHEVAKMYRDRFYEAREIFCNRYNRNLVSAFKKFLDAGRLEITTCAATHGFFPLMLNQETARGQIKTAIDLHTKHFGQPPQGIWLPECGYIPGIDNVLKEFNIKFFFVDTHGIMYASHRPRFGVFAPIFCPTGVAAFGRDIESSKQVWSKDEGYPGDGIYREFYRDIGYDLDFEYIKPYIHPDGIRIHTGIKYYRITGKTHDKLVYDPRLADQMAATHAGNFMYNRELQVEHLTTLMDRPPIIVAPYDAELYGHWWYEGPLWLNYLIRKMAYDQETVKLITPGDYLKMFPCNQVSTPCASTWGNKGYNEVWLNTANDWIYRHLHVASERMTELAKNYPHAEGDLRRALNQAARELLLAQSSDWAFIISTDTMVNYAIKRTKQHILNFTRLFEDIKNNRIDTGWLYYLEYQNNIFPDINYENYQPVENTLSTAVNN